MPQEVAPRGPHLAVRHASLERRSLRPSVEPLRRGALAPPQALLATPGGSRRCPATPAGARRGRPPPLRWSNSGTLFHLPGEDERLEAIRRVGRERPQLGLRDVGLAGHRSCRRSRRRRRRSGGRRGAEEGRAAGAVSRVLGQGGRVEVMVSTRQTAQHSQRSTCVYVLGPTVSPSSGPYKVVPPRRVPLTPRTRRVCLQRGFSCVCAGERCVSVHGGCGRARALASSHIRSTSRRACGVATRDLDLIYLFHQRSDRPYSELLSTAATHRELLALKVHSSGHRLGAKTDSRNPPRQHLAFSPPSPRGLPFASQRQKSQPSQLSLCGPVWREARASALRVLPCRRRRKPEQAQARQRGRTPARLQRRAQAEQGCAGRRG